jgi:hypothetical protein|tara:strand:- start:288 stop:569 length:282 start_codon:yes stop_codon:yes gene_type:complete
MIKYQISVLERMIEHYTMNIKMFQELQGQGDSLIGDIADMVANRRLVASFIENDGVPTVPVGFRNGDVFFDGMVNAACSGTEMSSWLGQYRYD